MNGAQPPEDLSKLKNILGNAKSIMNKVNDGNYETGNVDGNTLVQSTDGYVNDGNMSPNATTMGNSARQMKQPSNCLLYTSPSPRDRTRSRMPSSA